MATNNDNRAERTSYNISDLSEFTDDELVEITELLVLNGVLLNGEQIAENNPLSPRIGRCIKIKKLLVANCSIFPPEFSNCTLLKQLILVSDPGNDDDDCRIELPEGIILQDLGSVCIKGGGNWKADEIISWVASCSPNLRQLSFYDLTKDTANQFMRLLQDNEAFIEKFKHKLLNISFNDCSLNEDDALMLYVNIKPLYPRLCYIDLQNNNIESIESIGRAVRETPPANNNQLLPSNLRGLYLKGNAFVRNLNDPDSPDSVAMICLLKYHQLLYEIGDSNDNNLIYSPIINYWLMMNESELRYMLDDGHGGTRLNILTHVMKHVYKKRKQDPTTIFTFLREGPILRTRMQNNNDDNDDDNDDDKSTSNNALHSRAAIFITIVVTLMAMATTWQRQ